VETTAVVAMLGVSLQRLHGLAEPMVAFAAGPLSVWQAGNTTVLNMSLSIPVHTGVGIVTPVRFIRETLGDPKLVEERESRATELRAYDGWEEPAEATADSDLVDLGPTADLMGRLLQVPKEEADKVHRDHERHDLP
jgi:hypothetical protein